MSSYFGPHRKLNRWQKWNYSDFGFYFVTVCVKDRIEYFGRVEDGMMVLNEYGKVAQECWKNIVDHFDKVGIDEFIVMPNHIHGIVLLMDNVINVGNADLRSLQTATNAHHQQNTNNDRTKMLLPKIIHGFKSSVTRMINSDQHQFQFKWQKSFYDHIIRNEISLAKIRQYIINNPINWLEDRNNIPNLYY